MLRSTSVVAGHARRVAGRIATQVSTAARGRRARPEAPPSALAGDHRAGRPRRRDPTYAHEVAVVGAKLCVPPASRDGMLRFWSCRRSASSSAACGRHLCCRDDHRPCSTARGASRHQSCATLTSSNAALRRFLHGLPGVDQVGAEARAAMLGTRSIKTTAKAWALDLAISMVDLTTLEGADTPGKVRALCPRRCAPTRPTRPARRPPRSASTPTWCAVAKEALGDSGVQVAAVATAFPRGRAALAVKLADTAGRRRGRRRRDRHGHRPRRVPVRPLPAGLRRDRRGQGGLPRPTAPAPTSR